MNIGYADYFCDVRHGSAKEQNSSGTFSSNVNIAIGCFPFMLPLCRIRRSFSRAPSPTKGFTGFIMRRSSFLKSVVFLSVLVCLGAAPRPADATIVEFQTVMGNFEVNLFDNATPATVANFLSYVNNGAYSSSVIHRSVPDFVVQGGGFIYDQGPAMEAIPANPAVANEPEYSNVRGTIAMAKLSGNANSATNQWFFNLSNNSGNLDAQNGGFTAFGQVVGNGMDVVDAIAALPVYAFNSPFNELPLSNYTAADYANAVPVDDSHLVIITAIVVTDTTVNSAAGLNPVLNTSLGGGGSPGDGSGGGGSLGLFTLLALLVASRARAAKPARLGTPR